jgi:hypothetical protein
MNPEIEVVVRDTYKLYESSFVDVLECTLPDKDIDFLKHQCDDEDSEAVFRQWRALYREQREKTRYENDHPDEWFPCSCSNGYRRKSWKLWLKYVYCILKSKGLCTLCESEDQLDRIIHLVYYHTNKLEIQGATLPKFIFKTQERIFKEFAECYMKEATHKYPFLTVELLLFYLKKMFFT